MRRPNASNKVQKELIMFCPRVSYFSEYEPKFLFVHNTNIACTLTKTCLFE